MFFGIFFGMMEPLRPAATPPGEGNTTPACGHPSGGGEYHPGPAVGTLETMGTNKMYKNKNRIKKGF